MARPASWMNSRIQHMAVSWIRSSAGGSGPGAGSALSMRCSRRPGSGWWTGARPLLQPAGLTPHQQEALPQLWGLSLARTRSLRSRAWTLAEFARPREHCSCSPGYHVKGHPLRNPPAQGLMVRPAEGPSSHICCCFLSLAAASTSWSLGDKVGDSAPPGNARAVGPGSCPGRGGRVHRVHLKMPDFGED